MGITNWSSVEFWRAILRGEDDNAQLLCANCHAIKTRLGGEHTLTPSEVPFDPWDTGTASNDNIRPETVKLQIGAIAA